MRSFVEDGPAQRISPAKLEAQTALSARIRLICGSTVGSI